MDVFGSSRNVLAHEAAMEVFGNPTQTKHPDLCERYLWALSQLENCPEKVTKGINVIHEKNSEAHISIKINFIQRI